MLKTIISVPVIMACALAGTVGLIKAIGKFCPEQMNGAYRRYDTPDIPGGKDKKEGENL